MSDRSHRRILHETLAASSLRLILGSRPFDGAKIWMERGVIRAARGDVFVQLERTLDRRVLRGDDALRKLAVEAQLVRTEEDWLEVYYELVEYDSLAALYQRRGPLHWRSMRLGKDSSSVTVHGSHAIGDGEDVVRRTVYRVHSDGTRVEEQEEVVSTKDSERYEVTRFEFDRRHERTRSTHQVYPALSPRFYRRMRDRIRELGR